MPNTYELFLHVLALFDTRYARLPFDIAVIFKSLTVTNRMANPNGTLLLVSVKKPDTIYTLRQRPLEQVFV